MNVRIRTKRIISIFLAVIMIVTMCIPSSSGTYADEVQKGSGNYATQTDAVSISEQNRLLGNTLSAPDGLTLSNFTIKVNGTEVANDSNVKNGDEVEISFAWAIANTSRIQEFSVDLQAQGITINDYSETILSDTAGREVGTWYIQDGKFYITLDAMFVEESNISGGGNIKGVVDFSGDDLDSSDKGIFGIGDTTYQVNVDLNEPESGMSVYKNTNGSAVINSDGTITQSYTITITPYNGEITINSVSDTLGSGLENMSNIKVNGNTYSSWDELNTALSGYTLDSNNSESLTITYDVTISADNVSDVFTNQNSNNFQNTFRANYTTNKDNPANAESTSWGINVTRPSVSKGGIWNTDAEGNKETVTWTITVNPGDLAEFDDFNPENITLEDILNTNLTPTDLPDGIDLSNIKLSQLTKNDNTGEYTLSYTTSVSEDVLNSEFPVTLDNRVTVDFGDGITSETSASVVTDGRDVLSKEFVSLNEDDTLTWKIVINVPSAGIKNVQLTDQDGNWQSVLNQTTVVVDGTEVITDGSIVPGNGIISGYNNYGTGFSINFEDSYFTGKEGQQVEITVTSAPTLSDGATFRNTASLSYQDNENNSYNESAEDSYTHTSNIDKQGTVSQNELNTVNYTVDVNLTAMYEGGVPEVGDVITIRDTLPENMTLNDDSQITYLNSQNQWYMPEDTTEGLPKTVNKSISGNTVTFTITVNDVLKEAIERVGTSGWEWVEKYVLRLTYSATVSDDYLREFISNGQPQEFTNNARVRLNDEFMGHSSSTNTLTPAETVSKSGYYNVNTKRAEYTVYVNPSAADLSDADTIIAEDIFGSALIFLKDTLVIQKYVGNGMPENDTNESSWQTLSESEYKYTYDNNERKLIMTLPDSTALRITYSANINQYIGGSLDASNSTNSFSIYGFAESNNSDSTSFATTVQRPAVWSDSETASVTLYKFWTDSSNQMVALQNSKFALYEGKYSNGELSINASPVAGKGTIELGSDGTVIIDNLAYDQIYALVETDADEGFSVNSEPYYFIVCDADSNVTVPDGVDKYFYMGYLYYENTPADNTLSLSARKTIDGSTDTLSNYSSFNFTLTEQSVDGDTYSDMVGGISYTASSDTQTGTASFNKITYSSSDVGTHYYKISETAGSQSGLSYDSSYYIVTVEVNENDLAGVFVNSVSVDKYDKNGNKITGDYSVSAITFNNTTAPDLSRDYNFSASKLLDGATDGLASFGFTFKVYEISVDAGLGSTELENLLAGNPSGSEIAEGTSNALGTVIFDNGLTYTYSDVGETYYYKICEDDSQYSGIAKDSSYYIIRHVISANADTTQIVIDETITKYVQQDGGSYTSSGNANSVSFDNTTESADVTLSVKKTIDGTTEKLAEAGSFEFNLVEQTLTGDTYSDKTGGISLTADSSTQDGTATFDAIEYTSSDIGSTYYYKIYETAGNNSDIVYDR